MAAPGAETFDLPTKPRTDYNKGHPGANNFTIGHDFSVTKGTLQSVFKKDYPEHGQCGRADLAELPRLGDVMHKDDRILERASETVSAFEYRPLAKPVLMDVANKFSSTNFKMDSDTTKIDSFQTTHTHYFRPKMGDTFTPLNQTITSQISCIPQGDREKAELPISDYKYKFPGIDTNKVRVERAICVHNEGPPTIKGDNRLGHYMTSSRTQFQGQWAPKVNTLPVPPSYNVPVGDPDKENTKLTVMQSSFGDYSPNIKAHTPFDTGSVSRMLRQTNFKQRDGHGVWDNYQTIASSSYVPTALEVHRPSSSRHRNASDFPEGDREPSRDKERMNLTTTRFHHGNPATGLHNRIVSGANKRTQSNVWFGDPDLNKLFYSTSTKEVFDPKFVPCNYSRQMHYTPSSVPLDYYSQNMTYDATTSKDYTNPKQDKMMLDPRAVKSLHDSHILPQQKHMTFDTTHRDVFTPKAFYKHKYDSGKLQKSSVPLGTMAI